MKYVAGNNKVLPVKLRRDIASHSPLSAEKVVVTRFDTLGIPDFLEFIYPMRIAVLTLS